MQNPNETAVELLKAALWGGKVPLVSTDEEQEVLGFFEKHTIIGLLYPLSKEVLSESLKMEIISTTALGCGRLWTG